LIVIASDPFGERGNLMALSIGSLCLRMEVHLDDILRPEVGRVYVACPFG